MKAQVLATLAVFALTYLLLRLRHFILAAGKNKRKYYRAYIARFDEADGDSNTDDPSTGKPGAGDTVNEWPAELEFQEKHSDLWPEVLADGGLTAKRLAGRGVE